MHSTSSITSFNIIHWGSSEASLSNGGTFVNQYNDKTKLTQLFITARKDLITILRETHPDQIDESSKFIDMCMQNSRKLMQRYQKRLIPIFSRFFNEHAVNALNALERFEKNAKDVKTLLAEMKAPSLTQEETDQVFKNLLEKDWKGNIALLEPLLDESLPIAPLRQRLLSWTERRSIRRFTLPDIPKGPKLSCREIHQLISHMNFQGLSVSQIRTIQHNYVSLVNEPPRETWDRVSAIFLSMAKALEGLVRPREVIRLVLTSNLMKLSKEMRSVVNVRNSILYGNFPADVPMDLLLKLMDSGLLFGESSLLGFVPSALFHRIFNEPEITPFIGEDSSIKARAFVLRFYKRQPIQEHSVAYYTYTLLNEHPHIDQLTCMNQQTQDTWQLFRFYSLYDWLTQADEASYQEFAILYPSYAHLVREVNGSVRGGPTALHDAIAFVHSQREETSLHRSCLLTACMCDISFPMPVRAFAWKCLMSLNDRCVELLAQDYPYVHGLIKSAKGHLSSKHRLTHSAPLDLLLNQKRTLTSPIPNKDYSLSELIIYNKILNGLVEDFELPPGSKPWLPYYEINRRAMNIDDDWLETAEFSNECDSAIFTGSSLTPYAVLRFQAMHPQIAIQYQDILYPGRHLLTIHPDLYPEAYQSLVKEIAPSLPPLTSDEEKAFLEFCFTHEITAAKEVLASLVIQAKTQEWRWIGDYCLAHLISNIETSTIFDYWELSLIHPFLESLRHHCLRYIQAVCLQDDSWTQTLTPNQAHEIYSAIKALSHAPKEDFMPPMIPPVYLGKHFSRDHLIICADDEEVHVNMLFLSLHSPYFEAMFVNNSSSKMAFEEPSPPAEEGREMTVISFKRPEDTLEDVWGLRMVTAFQLKVIYEYLCSYELPEKLNAQELQELITVADFLMLPSVIVAARERLKLVSLDAI